MSLRLIEHICLLYISAGELAGFKKKKKKGFAECSDDSCVTISPGDNTWALRCSLASFCRWYYVQDIGSLHFLGWV